MRRAVRYLVVVIGIVAMTVTASGAAFAAVTPLTASLMAASIQPGRGQVVGVAHPITVSFTTPVANRTAVERIMKVTSSRPVEGRFTWLSDRVVEWTPQGFWPAYTTVKVSVGGLSTDFQSGAAVMGVADINAHTFTVSIDGEVVREMPASMGKSGFATPVGSFRAMAKERSVIMDSRTIGIPLNSAEGYRINVSYAVRITSGGVYVHSAPWSVDSQGYANVSHGCINLGPDNAAWFFNTVSIGDPVIVQY